LLSVYLGGKKKKPQCSWQDSHVHTSVVGYGRRSGMLATNLRGPNEPKTFVVNFCLDISALPTTAQKSSPSTALLFITALMAIHLHPTFLKSQQ
jgi:hypothetical protein